MQGELFGVVILFGAALVAAWIMRVLRAPTILGFIIAGVVVGPSGLGLIHETGGHSEVHFFAELGLALLLFTVGLELSPEPLLRAGVRLLIAAGVQMLGTTALVAVALVTLVELPTFPAVLVGLAASLSSTAIVLKHLSDQREIDSPGGTLTTGVLLVQDIAVILVLILLPLLNNGAGAAWPLVVLKVGLAIGGLVVVTLLAHLATPWIVRLVFRFGGRDFTTLFAIVMATTAAWLASLADWSWALGAFIAGLLLAQTDLRHQLHAEITPFRDAFNALFFMSIGMLVDIELFLKHPVPLGAAIVVTLLLKSVLATVAAVLARWSLRVALFAGLGLSTISEFGYVLVRQATDVKLVPASFMPLFVAWAVGTMLIGAMFVPIAAPVANWVTRRRRARRTAGDAAAPGAGAASPRRPSRIGHVIIVGYGINGRNLALVLKQTRIPFAVVEMNRRTAQIARDDGAEVLIGDATRMSILEEVGLDTARALVVSIDDQHAVRSIVAQAHRARPQLYILARTRHVTELDVLHRLGAQEVIPEEFETSIEIFAHVLKEFAVPDNVIDQQVSLIRAGQYGMLRGRTSADRKIRSEWLQLLESALTQTFLVMEGSIACGKNIRDLDLRAKTGVTIVAVTRNGKPIPNPPLHMDLQPNDVLVLVGTHRELDQARAYLNPPDASSPST